MMAGAESDESIAGITDERHAGVTDEGDFGALLHGDDEFRGAGHFVVLVIGDERFADFVVGEEFLRVTRVFAGDLVGFFENAEGAKSDVFEIADGRADEVEAAAGIGRSDEHGGSLTWGKTCGVIPDGPELTSDEKERRENTNTEGTERGAQRTRR